MTRRALLLSLLLGCTPPSAEIPEAKVPESSPASAEDSIRPLLAGLREPNPAHRKAAAELLAELGPGTAPALRSILTRRTAAPDPAIRDAIASLRADNPDVRHAALDHLLEAGGRAAPELWETMFSSSSPELVLKCVEILTLLEGSELPPSPIVDILMRWQALPAYAAATPAEARIAPVQDPGKARLFGRLQDDYNLQDALKDVEYVAVYLPVQAEASDDEDYEPFVGPPAENNR